jgi:hypothetical protein
MGLGRSSPKLFSPFYTFITFYHIFYIFTLFHLSFAVYRYTPHLPYSQTLRYITFPDSLPPDSYPPFSTFHFLRQIHFSLSTPNSLFTFRPSFLFPFFSNFIFYTPYSSPSAVFILGSLHPRPCGPRALGSLHPRPCGPRPLAGLLAVHILGPAGLGPLAVFTSSFLIYTSSHLTPSQIHTTTIFHLNTLHLFIYYVSYSHI